MIAIVDDDLSFREALVGLVNSFGFPAVPFGSAHEVLQFDRLQELRCLITDVQMPGMSGIELQSSLAASGRAIPTIFVTSFPDDRIRSLVLERGAVGLLGKPFDREKLLNLIRQALGCGD